MKITLILFLFLGFVSCNNNVVCSCDLELNDYLVKKVEIISTNSNKNSIANGKVIELSTSITAESNLSKLNRLEVDTFVISIPSLDKKKYYQTSYILHDKSQQDVNTLNYHLLYCSYYPIYHRVKDTCYASDGWEEKIVELSEIIFNNKNEDVTKANSTFKSTDSDYVSRKTVNTTDLIQSTNTDTEVKTEILLNKNLQFVTTLSGLFKSSEYEKYRFVIDNSKDFFVPDSMGIISVYSYHKFNPKSLYQIKIYRGTNLIFDRSLPLSRFANTSIQIN